MPGVGCGDCDEQTGPRVGGVDIYSIRQSGAAQVARVIIKFATIRQEAIPLDSIGTVVAIGKALNEGFRDGVKDAKNWKPKSDPTDIDGLLCELQERLSAIINDSPGVLAISRRIALNSFGELYDED